MPRGTYARSTSVSVDKSKTEIESTLRRFGASQFMYAWKDGAAIIEFVAQERRIRFLMKLPSKDEKEFTHRTVYGRDKKNSPEMTDKLWEQACRQRWRALALLVKAKLAGVEAGITSFEEEFLSHIVVPTGPGQTATAAEWLLPQIVSAYKGGGLNQLPLLPSG